MTYSRCDGRRLQVWDLKIEPEWFEEILDGVKDYELRKMERDYQPGDGLILREWEDGAYTGRSIGAEILSVHPAGEAPGLRAGWCVLGIRRDYYLKNFR